MAMKGITRSGTVPSTQPLEEALPLAAVPVKLKKPAATVDTHQPSAPEKKVNLAGDAATQEKQSVSTSRLPNDWLGAGPAESVQETVAKLIDAPSPRVALYQESLRRAPSVEALAKSRYGDEIGLSALKKLEGLGEGFGQLVADPGIVMRLNDFLAFAGTKDLTTLKPWDLRQSYSEHLGTAHMTRGLAITQPQAEAMKTSGMTAGYLRPDSEGDTGWSKGDPFSQNFYSMMKERIHGGGWGPISNAPEQPALDGLMSVTPKRSVAMLVTGEFVSQINKLGHNEYKVWLFNLEIPRLDLLPGPVFDAFPDHVNDDELFVPFMFRKDEIAKVEGPLEPEIIDLSKPD